MHPIAPVFDASAYRLILGSFPSVKSREGCFFYHHPQNRFWKVLSAVFKAKCPLSIDEKKEFLYCHGLALWDVIASCDIEASADKSIKRAVPNDISRILSQTQIKKIYLNGATAFTFYKRLLAPSIVLPYYKLPSTSPANAGYSLERLVDAWMLIKE